MGDRVRRVIMIMNGLSAIQQRWRSLQSAARMLCLFAIFLCVCGSCNIGFWAIRDNYLSRKVPERERLLREFLARSSNYRDKLGGSLSSFSIEKEHSDAFATYTTFMCSGQVKGDRIEFEALVQRSAIHLTLQREK